MSVKKDRFNKRKHRNAKRSWYGVPACYRRGLNRLRRGQISQLLREGRYDAIPTRLRKDAAWLFW